jgi:hypothetical protein
VADFAINDCPSPFPLFPHVKIRTTIMKVHSSVAKILVRSHSGFPHLTYLTHLTHLTVAAASPRWVYQCSSVVGSETIPKSFGQALRNSKTTSKSANATRLQELLSAQKGLAEGKSAAIKDCHGLERSLTTARSECEPAVQVTLNG